MAAHIPDCPAAFGWWRLQRGLYIRQSPRVSLRGCADEIARSGVKRERGRWCGELREVLLVPGRGGLASLSTASDIFVSGAFTAFHTMG